MSFQELRGWLGRQERGDRSFLKTGIGRGIAKKLLVRDGLEFVAGANSVRVGVASEVAMGLIALLLSGGNFAVKPAEELNQPGVAIEMGFGVVGLGELLEKDLREASCSGLKTYFREVWRVVAAKEIEEVILLEPVFDGLFLGERPFEITAGKPIGNIALGDAGEPDLVQSGDDVFVGNGIPEHAIDHVALRARETGDAAVASGFALGDGDRELGGGNGIRDSCRFIDASQEGGWGD
jgi:hypothetical protein